MLNSKSEVKESKQYGHWMEVWAELSEPNNVGHAALGLIGGAHQTTADQVDSTGTRFQRMAGAGGVAAATN